MQKVLNRDHDAGATLLRWYDAIFNFKENISVQCMRIKNEITLRQVVFELD